MCFILSLLSEVKRDNRYLVALCRRLKLNLNPSKAYLRQLMNNFNEKKKKQKQVNQHLQMIFNVGINKKY